MIFQPAKAIIVIRGATRSLPNTCRRKVRHSAERSLQYGARETVSEGKSEKELSRIILHSCHKMGGMQHFITEPTSIDPCSFQIALSRLSGLFVNRNNSKNADLSPKRNANRLLTGSKISEAHLLRPRSTIRCSN